MPQDLVQPTDQGASATPAQVDKNGAEARIKQLVAQRKAVEQELFSMKEQMAELRGTVEALRGTSPARNGESGGGAIQSWEQVPDEKLQDAYAMARQENNPALEFQALQELTRRQAERTSKSRVQSEAENWRLRQEASNVDQRILTDFGPEAGDTDSELHMKASQYAGGLRQRYGNDVFSRFPDMAYFAFLKAHHDLQSGSSDRLKELEAENARLKALTSMEPGTGRGGAPPSDAVREALSHRDPRAAIKALRITNSLR